MVETQEFIFGNSWGSEDKFRDEEEDKGSAHDGCQHRLFEQNELEALNFSERKNSTSSAPSPPPPLEPPPLEPPPPNDTSKGNDDNDEDDGDSNRVRILEGRLEFVRVEHQRLLKDLHDQVEGLKRKNKELQFTLIMQGVTSGLAPSASDENIDSMEEQQQQQKQQHEVVTSCNVQLQKEEPKPSEWDQQLQQQQQQQQLVAVKISEELETTIKQLRAELHEAKSRNLYLTERVEEQQRKITNLEENALLMESKTEEASEQAEVITEVKDKLVEAEVVIEQLRRENMLQRKELMDIKSNMERNAKLKYRGCNHPGMSRMSGYSTSSSSMKRAESLDQLPMLEAGAAMSRRGKRTHGIRTIRGKSPALPIKDFPSVPPGSKNSNNFNTRPPLGNININSNNKSLPSLRKASEGSNGSSIRRWRI